MEFQAIVMAAGTGSRIRELSSNIPKCLLPVGNVPLIVCSLNILKRAGFTEALVLVQESERTKIQNAIENKTDLKLDIISIPRNEDWGTADSLRHVKDKIRSDVLVLSSDLVSDVDLLNMAYEHCRRDSSLTVLLSPMMKNLQEMSKPGYKTKSKIERDIIGLDTSSRLMFLNSEADYQEKVPFKLSQLIKHPRINVHSNLADAHVYMINKDLVHFIVDNPKISTLKGEFLPAAVSQQFSLKKPENKTEVEISDLHDNPLNLKELALELSSSQYYSGNSSDDKVKCYAYVDDESFCSRINTLVAYAAINKKISKHFNTVTGLEAKPHPYQKSQVDNESVIGENCELLAKASLKQSIMADNCKVDERTRIVGSVVMDNVQIGKECSIQDSIICSNARIEDRCSLKNCIVGLEQVVSESSKLANEILQCDDQLFEI